MAPRPCAVQTFGPLIPYRPQTLGLTDPMAPRPCGFQTLELPHLRAPRPCGFQTLGLPYLRAPRTCGSQTLVPVLAHYRSAASNANGCKLVANFRIVYVVQRFVCVSHMQHAKCGTGRPMNLSQTLGFPDLRVPRPLCSQTLGLPDLVASRP